MNQQEVLDLFRESGALLDGHFRLSSGLHSSRYLQSALVLQHPEFAEQLGRALAARTAHLQPTAVLSPALGGIVIGQEAARALHVRALFAERQDGALTLRRGFTLSPSDRVLVVEDVITTGGSTRETIAAAEAAGASVVGAAAIIDRGGNDDRVNVPLQALVHLDVPAYPPESCPLCANGLPVVKPGSRSLGRFANRPYAVDDMRTIKLIIAYDGTGYVGWQRQETGESIQGLIEGALAKIEGGPVTLHGAGRTDAGVHALGQVASARITASLDDRTLGRALNANLPPEIRILDVATVADDFHARFSATTKTYEYRIWNAPVVPPFVRLYTWHVPQPLDMVRLQEASAAIPGERDFAAFQGSGGVTHTTVRRILSAGWRADGEALTFDIRGEGFLRHMVRSLVGTLIEIGHGRRGVDDFARLLRAPARADAGRTAPPHGLFLVRVDYG